MRITESLLRKLIREAILTEAAIAPDRLPLGKYAFSPQRQAAKKRPPMERNTPVESALLRSIINHFEGMRPLTRKQAEMVTGFIRDGLYPDVFKEAPPGTYYRGMSLTLDELERMGVDITELDPEGGKQELRGKFVIAPIDDRFSSSWSSDIEVADGFSLGRRSQREHNTYSVIFAASSRENLGKFLDAEGLYDIEVDEFTFFAQEKEVIGLGTINANWIRLMRLV